MKNEKLKKFQQDQALFIQQYDQNSKQIQQLSSQNRELEAKINQTIGKITILEEIENESKIEK